MILGLPIKIAIFFSLAFPLVASDANYSSNTSISNPFIDPELMKPIDFQIYGTIDESNTNGSTKVICEMWNKIGPKRKMSDTRCSKLLCEKHKLRKIELHYDSDNKPLPFITVIAKNGGNKLYFRKADFVDFLETEKYKNWVKNNIAKEKRYEALLLTFFVNQENCPCIPMLKVGKLFGNAHASFVDAQGAKEKLGRGEIEEKVREGLIAFLKKHGFDDGPQKRVKRDDGPSEHTNHQQHGNQELLHPDDTSLLNQQVQDAKDIKGSIFHLLNPYKN